MSARDQLADRIALILDPGALDPVAQEQARAVADAVMGMVVPLVWRENPDHGEGGFLADGINFTYHAMSDGWSKHRGLSWKDANGIEAAKSAANRHHLAQILAAIGMDASPAQIGDE